MASVYDTYSGTPQPQQQDSSPSGLYDMLMSYMADGQLDPTELGTLSAAFSIADVQQQAGQLDYQNHYLDYLNNQMGLNEAQLAQAQQEMEFKQGRYWDWYINSYFPAQQQMSKDQASISANQVAASQQDVQRAAQYALAQKYQTDQAAMARDTARYQALTSLGTVALQNQPMHLPDGRQVTGNQFTFGYTY